MTTVPQLAQTLQTVFTTAADATARATGFVQRRSKLTRAAFVQALVFGWLAHPHASIAALAHGSLSCGGHSSGLGVVTWSGGPVGGPGLEGMMPRPHLALPGWIWRRVQEAQEETV